MYLDLLELNSIQYLGININKASKSSFIIISITTAGFTIPTFVVLHIDRRPTNDRYYQP